MELHGKQIIAGAASANGTETFFGVDPSNGQQLEPAFFEATQGEVLEYERTGAHAQAVDAARAGLRLVEAGNADGPLLERARLLVAQAGESLRRSAESEAARMRDQNMLEFLTDAEHRVRFIYTPKHTSWLNQIEIWFSILCRKLLRRASFTSTEELRTRILDFIEYFNKTMAKPFKWTYEGRVLQA